MSHETAPQAYPAVPMTAAAAAPAIEVRHLAHRYGGRFLYRDLNFAVPQGKVVALLGIAVAVSIAIWLLRRRGPLRRVMLPAFALVALTGLYGLLALALFPPESAADRGYGASAGE
ncbi:MAG: hypothetical protein KFB96_21650 [Thiocapsa sp.]|uniref:hypothetical protein n=1 Tax=Thiocapsa sp. TaxID=2024551 RepID=UPI001BCEA856|nr:hypothetical protein [Thiocapsa sp.]QVL48201.1 MAG: hypothetical protein KFB96_21650 [Thiocapsa sp.]